MPLMRKPLFLTMLVLSALLGAFCSSCSGDYCIQCLDPVGARPPVEGCDDNLEGLETARAAYELEGFVCIIFEN
ncbi:MAG: hypothetical protein GC205_00010 [Bacteroidetes bacterium]|nr:hypothetical protein [Bacteroidota bacterium]